MKPEETASTYSAEDWRQAAIGSAVLLLVGFGAAAIWIIVAPSDTARLLRVQIVAPFGVFGGAFVTFCTILWRGLIATMQADLQREQIEKLSDQINETAERNLADLLQKGVELINVGEKRAQAAAGIATLNAVVTAKNPKFAVEAMNLIADFLQVYWKVDRSNSNQLFDAGVAVLRQGASRGLRSDRELEFKSIERHGFGNATAIWNVISGTKSVRYEGGKVDGTTIQPAISSGTRLSFVDTKILGGIIDTTANYYACHFANCKISRTNLEARVSFHNCDFSGAHVSGRVLDFRDGENYFYRDNPPMADDHVDWEEVFLVRDSN